MKLKGWQNWYSIPIYILIYGLWLPWHFESMQKAYNRTIGQNVQSKQFDFSGLPNAQPALKPIDNDNRNNDDE